MLATCAVAASIGAVRIPLGELIGLLKGLISPQATLKTPYGTDYATIFFKIRLVRISLAVLVGASLSVSGVVYQGIFKNPMADPYIIGVSSGAALGATIAALLVRSGSIFGFSIMASFAFIFATLAVFVIYKMAERSGRIPVETLLLAGIALGALFHALTSFIMVIGSRDLHLIIYWLMGGFSSKGWDHVLVLLPFILVGLPFIYFNSRELNLLLLGEERAGQLGIEVERVKRGLIIASSLLTAAAVSVGGIIGFVGLIVPHSVRLLTGPDHKILIPASALVGAIFLVLSDLLARVVIAPTEMPLGIITALFGAPFFVYLLRKRRGVII
ncbi:MAG: iron chelate uptake ABC transporter family permease subunit [Actinomycetota bacterium]|nr:iron chelate uptake ABC transporter family permease subunit [Actinomycetota bacterium]